MTKPKLIVTTVFWLSFFLSFLLIELSGLELCRPLTTKGQVCSTPCINGVCNLLIDSETIDVVRCNGSIKCLGTYEKNSDAYYKFSDIRKVAKVKETNETCMTPCRPKYSNDTSSYCLIGRKKTSLKQKKQNSVITEDDHKNYERVCYETDEESPVYFASGHNQQVETRCVGECMQAGFKYNWCFVNSSIADTNWVLDWDKCSREYGLSSSGKICQSPCESNGYFDYSCKTFFHRNKLVDEPCSPVIIRKPTSMHFLAKLSDPLDTRPCITACNNGVCGVETSTSYMLFANCSSSFRYDQLRNQYFTAEAVDQSVRCNGNCFLDEENDSYCYNVDSANKVPCSLADGGSSHNNLTCLSVCVIESKDETSATCFTEEGYVPCSPKPINKYKAFKFNQILKEILTESAVEKFGIWFKQLKEIFHVKVVDNTHQKGGVNATYYIDYIDGVPIVRGLQANVSRRAVLSKPIDWFYDITKNKSYEYRYLVLQRRKSDYKLAFLHPNLGGSMTDEINMVPVAIATSYRHDIADHAEEVILKIVKQKLIKSVDFKLIPLYEFDSHRPYGFIYAVTYEYFDNKFNITVTKTIESEILSKMNYRPDFENDFVKHDKKFTYLNNNVLITGAIANSILLSLYLKTLIIKKYSI